MMIMIKQKQTKSEIFGVCFFMLWLLLLWWMIACKQNAGSKNIIAQVVASSNLKKRHKYRSLWFLFLSFFFSHFLLLLFFSFFFSFSSQFCNFLREKSVGVSEIGHGAQFCFFKGGIFFVCYIKLISFSINSLSLSKYLWFFFLVALLNFKVFFKSWDRCSWFFIFYEIAENLSYAKHRKRVNFVVGELEEKKTVIFLVQLSGCFCLLF